MKIPILLIGLLVFAIVLSGCVGNQDVTSFVKTLPEAQAFLEKNPDAEIKAVFLNKQTVTSMIGDIREDCGQQMQEVPYWYVTITKGNQEAKIYLDETGKQALCIIKAGAEPPAEQDECNTDIQCNDNDPKTKDECKGTPKKCGHKQVTEDISKIQMLIIGQPSIYLLADLDNRSNIVYYMVKDSSDLDIASQELLTQYDIVLLDQHLGVTPHEKSVSRTLGEAIENYVKTGGKLIVVMDSGIYRNGGVDGTGIASGIVGWKANFGDIIPVECNLGPNNIPTCTQPITLTSRIHRVDYDSKIMEGIEVVPADPAYGPLTIITFDVKPTGNIIAYIKNIATASYYPAIVEKRLLIGKSIYFNYDPAMTSSVWDNTLKYLQGDQTIEQKYAKCLTKKETLESQYAECENLKKECEDELQLCLEKEEAIEVGLLPNPLDLTKEQNSFLTVTVNNTTGAIAKNVVVEVKTEASDAIVIFPASKTIETLGKGESRTLSDAFVISPNPAKKAVSGTYIIIVKAKINEQTFTKEVVLELKTVGQLAADENIEQEYARCLNQQLILNDRFNECETQKRACEYQLQQCLSPSSNLCVGVSCSSDKKCVNGSCVLKTCSERGGSICLTGQTCSGSTVVTSDLNICCIGNCVSSNSCADVNCSINKKCVNGSCALKSCSEMGGGVCTGNEQCDGTRYQTEDSEQCCVGTCREPGIKCNMEPNSPGETLGIVIIDCNIPQISISGQHMGYIIVKNNTGATIYNSQCVGSQAFAADVFGCPERIEKDAEITLHPIARGPATYTPVVYTGGYIELQYTNFFGVKKTEKIVVSAVPVIAIFP